VPAVHLLYHQFEFRNNKLEDFEERAKLIGVYSEEEEAKHAIERVKDKPGFRDYPDSFLIDCYELNQDHWQDGFVTLPITETPEE
jgi:hypothetical protein